MASGLVLALALATVGGLPGEQTAIVPRASGSAYPEIRTWHEQAARLGRPAGQQAESFRALPERAAVRGARIRSVPLGFGAVVAGQSLPDTLEDLRLSLDPETRSHATLLRLGENASWTTYGAASLVSSGASLAGSLSSDADTVATLLMVRDVGRGAAVVAFVTAEGFTVARWQYGYLTDREFADGQADLVGGYGGGALGAWVGFKVGAAAGAAVGVWVAGGGAAPGALIGGAVGSIAGGIAGNWAGSSAARYGVQQWFAIEDAAQQQQLRQFVFVHYGAAP